MTFTKKDLEAACEKELEEMGIPNRNRHLNREDLYKCFLAGFALAREKASEICKSVRADKQVGIMAESGQIESEIKNLGASDD